MVNEPDSVLKSKTEESVPGSLNDESLSSGEVSGSGDGGGEKLDPQIDAVKNKPVEQIKEKDSVEDDSKDQITQEAESGNVPFTIEDQLQLLLTNLKKNVALKKENSINEVELGK